MSDTHEKPTLSRNAEQEHPYNTMERFWESEVARNRTRMRSLMVLGTGVVGGLALLLLSWWAVAGTVLWFLPAVVVVATVASVPTLWLTAQGMQGLVDTSPPVSAPEHRGVRKGSQEKSSERKLLEVIEANGEITPARAALQTSLTVEEAEQLLSDLAQRGHLDVRVEGSRLVYSL